MKYIFMALVVFILSGCDKITELTQPNSSDIVNNYIELSLKKLDSESYKFISSEDKKIKTIDEYKRELLKQKSPIYTEMSKNITFKINSLKEKDDTAVAEVEISMPDVGILIKKFMKQAFEGILKKSISHKDIESNILKNNNISELPKKIINKKFSLIKEKDGWKIFLNWKKEKEDNEKIATIKKLTKKANSLKKADKLDEAIGVYGEILNINTSNKDASYNIKNLQKEIQKAKQEKKLLIEKQAYIKKIDLYSIVAKYFNTYLDKKIPGVQFKLKNNGDKTLSEVQVTFYFKDTTGKTIAEEKFYPILVSKYSFGKRNGPLKPNYIWQMEKDNLYTAKSVPTEWKEGSYAAKITNIEFVKN